MNNKVKQIYPNLIIQDDMKKRLENNNNYIEEIYLDLYQSWNTFDGECIETSKKVVGYEVKKPNINIWIQLTKYDNNICIII
uniref:Uncharacterized protein n=1 Tax=Pithovirus LCDPAC02 TaxID=2506601 RepID=A0A481YNL3_9VIRU|nr:MAG: hypothetical protein LCDPAC02_00600 [Pithovirus LCDPAC02]